eukprot:CFRG0780T1
MASSFLSRVLSLNAKPLLDRLPPESLATGIKMIQSSISKPFLDELNHIEEKNPYKNVTSLVRQGREICDEEIEFVRVREGEKTRKAIGDLLGQSMSTVPDEKLPRLGFAFSGGGFRSMVATAHTLKAAEEEGLLDAVTYVTGVSGGAWALAQWFGPEKGDLVSLMTNMKSLVQKDMTDSYSSEIMKLYLYMSLERLVNDEEYSTLEAYSSVLSHYMLQETAPHQQYLSDQKDILSSGLLPAPIYNSVFSTLRQPTDLRWLEMSPWEVGTAEVGQGMYIPTWAFGRPYLNGKSTLSFKEKPLGFLLAVVGGPFVASFGRMLSEIEHELPVDVGSAMTSLLQRVDLLDTGVVAPAQMHNFMYGFERLYTTDKELANADKISVMDAALDFNLPVPPLWRLERGVDVATVFDNSTAFLHTKNNTNLMGRELDLAMRHAVKNGIPFPDVPSEQWIWSGGQLHLTDESAYLLTDNVTGTPSRGLRNLVYCPLVLNKKFGDFDPQTGDFSTSNFTYNGPQYDDLGGLASANLKDSLPTIIEGIDRAFWQKNK